MLTNPPHGKPCNGCGGCCVQERCPLASMIFGPGDQCPALEMRLPAFTCGLVEHPGSYAPTIVMQHGAEAAGRAAALLIGAGSGCDAMTADEAPDDAWRDQVRNSIDWTAVTLAAGIWGVMPYRLR